MVIAAVAGAGLALPGSAAAGPPGMTLHYTCPASSAFSQPMTAQIVSEAPDSATAGEATPTAASLNVTATVGPTATWALRFDGVATVEGSVDAPATVVAPGTNIPTTVRLTVPRTSVPASGSMTVHATGTLPRLVFRQPGQATMTLANDLTAHITPRDAGGNVAAAGRFDYSCALDSGQNATVFSLDITPMPATGEATSGAGSVTGRGSGPGSGTASGTGAGTEAGTAVAPHAPTTSALSRKGFIKTGATLRPFVQGTNDFWRIGATGIGLAAIGVICGLWWLRSRRRRASG
jgi:hypothetical protein